jgi:flagellar hook-associated protein 3 FlgL
VTLGKQPADGDVVRVTVNQPDGSQKLVDYVARTHPTPGSTTEFAIGADTTATAKSLNDLVGSGVAAVQSGDPPAADLAVSAQGTAGSAAITVGAAADGDTVTVNLTLHDGTTTSLTLTAKANPNAADPTQFAIGATPDITAQNLRAKLEGGLKTAAGTTLAASSATLAAKDMFAGSSGTGLAPRRIDLTKTPPVFSTNPAGKTVTWYKGEDGPGDPRAAASVQVGEGYDIAYGARANEPAFQAALAGLGALASESFPSTGSNTVSAGDTARYGALSNRVASLLTPTSGGQTLAQLGTELGLANASMADAQTRNTATKTVLENTVSSIEDADPNTVVTQLVSLQTQLQASYQVTSMLSKLSLVNYL